MGETKKEPTTSSVCSPITRCSLFPLLPCPSSPPPTFQIVAVLKLAFPALLGKVTVNMVSTFLGSCDGDDTLSDNAARMFTTRSGNGVESAVHGNVKFGNDTKTVCIRGLTPPKYLFDPKNPSEKSIAAVGRSAFPGVALIPFQVRGRTMKAVLEGERNKDMGVASLIRLLHHGTRDASDVADAGCCHHDLTDKLACSLCGIVLAADAPMMSVTDARSSSYKTWWRRKRKQATVRGGTNAGAGNSEGNGDGDGDGAGRASSSSMAAPAAEAVTPKRRKIRDTLDAHPEMKTAVYMMIVSAESAKIQHHHQRQMAAAAAAATPQLPPAPAKTTHCTREDLAVSSAMLLRPVSPNTLRRISYRATALLYEAGADSEEDDDASSSTPQPPQPSPALEALMNDAGVSVDLRADTGARLAAQGFDDLAALTHYFNTMNPTDVRRDLQLQPIAQTKLHMHLKQMLSED